MTIKRYRIVEYRVVIPGKPLSSHSKSFSKYQDKIREIASGIAEIPLSYNDLTVKIDHFGKTPVRVPDLDNLSKVILDALKGFLYSDDKQIKNLNCKTYDLNKPFELINEPLYIIDPLDELEEFVVVRVISEKATMEQSHKKACMDVYSN